MLTKQERELVKNISIAKLEFHETIVSVNDLTQYVVGELLKDVFDAHKIDVNKLEDEVGKVVNKTHEDYLLNFQTKSENILRNFQNQLNQYLK